VIPVSWLTLHRDPGQFLAKVRRAVQLREAELVA
jgi:hypothetical protein